MSGLVIVTGASSGLGLALAQSVPFSARVVDISRSGPPSGTHIEHITADLSDPNSWPRVAGEVESMFRDMGPTRSVFIHSAGTLTPISHVSDADTTAYTRNVLLNSAAGQVLGMAFLKAVTASPSPAESPGIHDLVMISSGAASNAYPGWAAYGAGKAALDHWVRGVGLEQKIRGAVRVAAIAPGVLDTAMQAEIRATRESDFPDGDRFRKLKSEGNLVSPEDAAHRMWQLIESGLETGSVVDLRNL
ncbi:MAG TPA: SDR family NAD(P)-dependent oxidoreductase [Acidimicrobiia bacterium]